MQVAKGHFTVCTHTVNLLIIVKMFVLIKGSGNYHAFFGNVGQGDVKSEELARVAVVTVCTVKMPCFAVVFKGHVTGSDLSVNIALFTCGR